MFIFIATTFYYIHEYVDYKIKRILINNLLENVFERSPDDVMAKSFARFLHYCFQMMLFRFCLLPNSVIGNSKYFILTIKLEIPKFAFSFNERDVGLF